MSARRKIVFSSKLGKNHRDELETLMFFNPQQKHVESGILESIERYGLPKVAPNGEFLRVEIAGLPEVQTLFALETYGASASLIGVIVYLRVNRESIVVLHVGVREEYSIFGIYADEMLAMKLIVHLRQIARQIKGVRTLTVIYGKGMIRRIPV